MKNYLVNEVQAANLLAIGRMTFRRYKHLITPTAFTPQETLYDLYKVACILETSAKRQIVRTKAANLRIKLEREDFEVALFPERMSHMYRSELIPCQYIAPRPNFAETLRGASKDSSSAPSFAEILSGIAAPQKR